MGRRAYPIDPYHALRAANLRDATIPDVCCKTCVHFDGFKGHCNCFKVDVSMGKVCDEWQARKP